MRHEQAPLLGEGRAAPDLEGAIELRVLDPRPPSLDTLPSQLFPDIFSYIGTANRLSAFSTTSRVHRDRVAENIPRLLSEELNIPQAVIQQLRTASLSFIATPRLLALLKKLSRLTPYFPVDNVAGSLQVSSFTLHDLCYLSGDARAIAYAESHPDDPRTLSLDQLRLRKLLLVSFSAKPEALANFDVFLSELSLDDLITVLFYAELNGNLAHVKKVLHYIGLNQTPLHPALINANLARENELIDGTCAVVALVAILLLALPLSLLLIYATPFIPAVLVLPKIWMIFSCLSLIGGSIGTFWIGLFLVDKFIYGPEAGNFLYMRPASKFIFSLINRLQSPQTKKINILLRHHLPYLLAASSSGNKKMVNYILSKKSGDNPEGAGVPFFCSSGLGGNTTIMKKARKTLQVFEGGGPAPNNFLGRLIEFLQGPRAALSAPYLGKNVADYALESTKKPAITLATQQWGVHPLVNIAPPPPVVAPAAAAEDTFAIPNAQEAALRLRQQVREQSKLFVSRQQAARAHQEVDEESRTAALLPGEVNTMG